MAKQIWIRSTFYDPVKGAWTTVMSKDDTKEDIHIIANDLRERFGRKVDVEIFEWENDMILATKEAFERAKKRIPDTEHFKNTLHDFLIALFFKIPTTTMIAPASPAPLSTEDIKKIFEAVKQHPKYENRSIKVTSKDGGVVWLTGGDVSVR